MLYMWCYRVAIIKSNKDPDHQSIPKLKGNTSQTGKSPQKSAVWGKGGLGAQNGAGDGAQVGNGPSMIFIL